MKHVYIETWTRETVFNGRVVKLDLDELVNEYDAPKEILEMGEDEFSDWWVDNQYDYDSEWSGNNDLETILEGTNYSDPDTDTYIYMNKKDALEGISWRGFNKACGWKETEQLQEQLKEE